MHLTELLGKQLKSETIVALLEEHDVDVIYDFDPLLEGDPDVY